jgi:hypothetical protein
MERIRKQRRGLRATVLSLAAVVGVALAVSAAVYAATTRAAVAPANTSPPTISGAAQVGGTLTAQNGTWTGTEPITYTYQWRHCDQGGASCVDISGATNNTYTLTRTDSGNTVRVVVTAKNTDGSQSGTSAQTALVSAGAGTDGCPTGATGDTAVPVTSISAPARLQVDQFQAVSPLSFKMTSFQLRVHVGSTCNQAVQGANVYATAVPFQQVSIPPQTPTGSDGWVTLTFNRLSGFPVSPRQQLMAIFIRATKPGENILAGVSTRRLISLRVHH